MRQVAELLPGVHLLELEPRHDERGYFARSFCRQTLGDLGVSCAVEQANLSLSEHRHTLRGMHYQLHPGAETKIVTCMRGALFDVVVDLRQDLPSYRRWVSAELSEDNRRMMVVPPGCAHGFLTLQGNTLAFYLVSAVYNPLLERGLRWDDSAFAIEWPTLPVVLSDRDRAHPDFDTAWHLAHAA